MNILIITQDYPDRKRNAYAFVQQLVNQIANMGHDCCVISPYSIVSNHGWYKFKERQKIGKGNIEILRPNHISLSKYKILGFSPTNYFRKLAIKKAIRQLPFKPDVIYAHFWRSGREIYPYAKRHNIPLFIATGESVIPRDDINPSFKDFYDFVRGVICVSTKNKDESISNGMTKDDKCIVLPNSINPSLFRKMDRDACRKELNISKDVFLVAFCGALCHRKGVGVLSEAIDSIKGEPVYSFFIGRPYGELPTCSNIIYQGSVPHDNLVTYLNAADVFVLPTLHEGCCNAIIEALACGLPIISSNLHFNWDVLDETNSILVDPNSSEQIAKAIIELRDDKGKRGRLASGAIETAKHLTLEERASKIFNFIEERMTR